MRKQWPLALIVLAIFLDLGLTFSQNYHMPLDGDMGPIVVPRADYAHVLQDPFGWDTFVKNGTYAAPNRFFAHATMYWYFRQVPLWLQAFLSPISSAYAAMAIFNTTMQVLLLYVLGWYATGTRRLSSPRLWLAMGLMMPFFQTTGYHGQMSLVTTSISFAFAYTFPLLLLLLLLWPHFRAASLGQPMRVPWPQLVAMLLLCVVLAFNGPLLPGTALVLLLGVGLHAARQRWPLGRGGVVAQLWRGLPWQPVLVWGWLGGLCLFSLYIGRNNSENLMATMPLWARYKLLPMGVYEQLTVRLGLPLLILGCLANVQLIRRQLPLTPAGQRIVRQLRWVGWFALVYVLLLPLGGYRGYRPFLLRYDSILPITIGLVWFYGLSSAYLLARLPRPVRYWYTAGLVVIAFIFMNADRRPRPADDNNTDERHALEVLAHAGPGPVVRLPQECKVMSWEVITNPNESITNAEMLEYWGVTKGRKLYYYPAR